MIPARRANLRVTAFLIAILTLIGVGLTFFIPVASNVDNAAQAHARTAVAAAMAGLYIGTAVWFWGGLREFKTRLRVAYILLGIGLIIFAGALLQLPVAGLLGLFNAAWFTGGGAIVVFTMAIVVMYIAVRQLARLVGVRSRLTSFWLVLTGAVLCGVAMFGFATLFLTYELEGADVYVGSIGWAGGFALFAGLLALRTMTAIGPEYRHSTKWLAIAFFSIAAGALHEGVSTTFISNYGGYNVWGIYLWPFVISGFMWVKACYEFRRLTVGSSGTVPAERPAEAVVADHDYIEGVLTISRMASRPEEIDPIMDDLRLVTSNAHEGTPLTMEQKQRLLVVYRKLEDYLMQKDPLRTFSKEEIRDRIPPALAAQLDRQ
jgi:hypothetical protein